MRTTLLKEDYFDLTHTNLQLPNFGNAAGLQPSGVAGTFFVNLHSAFPTASGSFANVLSYTGYAEQTVARSTAGWTVSGSTVDNDALISFGLKTGGSDVTARWVSISGTTGANMFWTGPLALAGSHKMFTAATSGNLFTAPGHTLAVNDQVIFLTPSGGTTPGGVTEGTNYFVISVSGDTFTVSATLGGSSITVSSSGSGVLFEHVPLLITTTPGINPQIPIGALDFIAAL